MSCLFPLLPINFVHCSHRAQVSIVVLITRNFVDFVFLLAFLHSIFFLCLRFHFNSSWFGSTDYLYHGYRFVLNCIRCKIQLLHTNSTFLKFCNILFVWFFFCCFSIFIDTNLAIDFEYTLHLYKYLPIWKWEWHK